MTLVGLVAFVIIAFIIYQNTFYVKELNQIKKELNQLENIEVVNIWGHEDMTMTQISVRLKIENKGEIVLYGLSKDSFNYPKKVIMTEIGGYTFTSFFCNGRMSIGQSIDIGQHGELGELINMEFKTVKDVVDNYDLILESVKTLKMSPEINHFDTKKSESYLLIKNKKSIDQDPLFNLVGIEKKAEFARTLQWNNPNCY
ncbi:MAG: hypothetical protein ABJL44_03670 [Algibacter sp.]